MEFVGGDVTAAIERFKRVAKAAHKIGSESALLYDRGIAWLEAGMPDSLGQLYHAEIPEDSDLMDWDKPLSEQPEKVKNALKDAELFPAEGFSNPTGRVVYGNLVNRVSRAIEQGWNDTLGGIHVKEDPQQAVSEYLNSIGIPGLRYLDGTSRGKGDGSYNYVIWDETLLTPEKAEITPYYSKRDKPKPKVTGARPEELIEVRKQISSFRTLIKCLGG